MSETESIKSFSTEQRRFEPSREFSSRARVRSREDYDALYQESLDAPESFWSRETQELVFRRPWTQLLDWQEPFARWFVGSQLNITESCLDRHLSTERRDKPAIIWEGEPGETITLSYAELHRKVVELSAALRAAGVKPGDRVAIYMGMVPEAIVSMLACARIGAPHTVVFGGFAADALKDRINDCQAKVLLTQDGSLRRGKVVPLKATADAALEGTPSVTKVFVYRRLGQERCPIELTPGRDVDFDAAIAEADSKLGEEPAIVDAEHTLFILYTSGSTGKPKGVKHTTAGYLAGVHVTTKYVFDLRDDDVYFCTADVGWITGHSYLVYGPLSNGATVLVYEGAPDYPDWGRFWQIVQKHRVTILYTAPTAIRAFIKAGTEWIEPYDLSSLRLLGSVGEPINPEAWVWYYEKIGQKRCPVVDTWWQTETGAIMMTTLPGAHTMKPGSCGLPFFGVEPHVVTKAGRSLTAEEGGTLIVSRPWPSMLRTIWGDDDRYRQYFSDASGVYLTGDGAHVDRDGYFTVIGRIDDVLNVAGHRIGTAEIESCLVAHPAVAEAAAVGRSDEIKGQALVVFVTLKPGFPLTDDTRAALSGHVATEIGKFARPDEVRLASGLPKTRSGKIMRRLLKDIAAGRPISGDLSTLEDQSLLEQLAASTKDS